MGQAAIFGAGCHAVPATDSKPAVATCTTGTGEYLIRTGLAKLVAERVQSGSVMEAASAMDDAFLRSPVLSRVQQPVGGVLAVSFDVKTGATNCIISHTAATMVASCMQEADAVPRIMEVAQSAKKVGLNVCSHTCKVVAYGRAVQTIALT